MFHLKQGSCVCKLYVFSGVYGHLIGEVPWEAADFCVDEQVATLVGESHLSGLVVCVSRQYQTKIIHRLDIEEYCNYSVCYSLKTSEKGLWIMNFPTTGISFPGKNLVVTYLN